MTRGIIKKNGVYAVPARGAGDREDGEVGVRAPYWESDDGQIVLYHGDCLEVMREMEAGTVDAVVTDPPFNAGKAFANDALLPDDASEFVSKWAARLAVLKPKHVVVEIPKNNLTIASELSRWFTYRWAICLNYTNSMRNGAVGYANWGLVLWFSGGTACENRYRDRIDCTIHSTLKEFRHPSPKEVGHYTQLVQMFSREGQTVLDPFMGSGTTGIACVRTGRRFIGIEISEEYCALAKKRIIEAKAQGRLAFPAREEDDDDRQD